jgi:hypothetical protein
MDQHIVSRFRQGTLKESACISCNGCITEMHRQNIRCVYNTQLVQY